jgi:lambda repressor-like predicted transcriptional regulator
MEEIEDLPKNIIKSELKRKGLRVKHLVEELKKYGEDLTETSFNNKMSRGGFSAVFFLKCMKALEVNVVRLGE